MKKRDLSIKKLQEMIFTGIAVMCRAKRKILREQRES